ncbi:hypothetical protein GOV09_06480 [Candidatus Woesearchaeota archaeon]|nr:hypothetical protein [Candidatus Woesearchaeota archaeon]
MIRQAVYLMMAVVLLGGALAATQEVVVFKLHYDHGEVKVLNFTKKYGFTPDRRIQPDPGYMLRVLSDEGVIHEFRFKVPNELIAEGTDETGELKGGKIVLEDMNFALSIPHFDEMTSIEIYSENDEVVGTYLFPSDDITTIKSSLIGFIIIVTIVSIGFIFWRYKRRS